MKLWAKILIVVLVLALLGGGIFGIVKLADEGKLDSKNVSDLAFSIGGLDGAGKYKNTDASIYTKDAIECQGLNCTLVFDSDIWYQVYFYDQNNDFVHTTGKLTGAFVQDSVPFFAKYARIVITPNDDEKVGKLEVLKYARQLKVTVYREQGFKNYTEDLMNIKYEHGSLNTSTGVITGSESGTTCVSDYINISSYKETMLFRTHGNASLNENGFALYDKNRTFVQYVNIGSHADEVFTTSEGIIYYSIKKSSLGLSDENDAYFMVISGNPAALPEIHCR